MQPLTQDQKDFTKNMTVFMYDEIVQDIIPALKQLRKSFNETDPVFGAEASKIKITLTLSFKPTTIGLSVEF